MANGFQKQVSQTQATNIPDAAFVDKPGAHDYSDGINQLAVGANQFFEGRAVDDLLGSDQLELQVTETPTMNEGDLIESRVKVKDKDGDGRAGFGKLNSIAAMRRQGMLTSSQATTRAQAALRTAINDNPAHEQALIKAYEKTFEIGLGGSGGILGATAAEDSQAKLQQKAVEQHQKAQIKLEEDARAMGMSVPQMISMTQTLEIGKVEQVKRLALADKNKANASLITNTSMNEWGVGLDNITAELFNTFPDGIYTADALFQAERALRAAHHRASQVLISYNGTQEFDANKTQTFLDSQLESSLAALQNGSLTDLTKANTDQMNALTERSIVEANPNASAVFRMFGVQSGQLMMDTYDDIQKHGVGNSSWRKAVAGMFQENGNAMLVNYNQLLQGAAYPTTHAATDSSAALLSIDMEGSKISDAAKRDELGTAMAGVLSPSNAANLNAGHYNALSTPKWKAAIETNPALKKNYTDGMGMMLNRDVYKQLQFAEINPEEREFVVDYDDRGVPTISTRFHGFGASFGRHALQPKDPREVAAIDWVNEFYLPNATFHNNIGLPSAEEISRALNEQVQKEWARSHSDDPTAGIEIDSPRDMRRQADAQTRAANPMEGDGKLRQAVFGPEGDNAIDSVSGADIPVAPPTPTQVAPATAERTRIDDIDLQPQAFPAPVLEPTGEDVFPSAPAGIPLSEETRATELENIKDEDMIELDELTMGLREAETGSVSDPFIRTQAPETSTGSTAYGPLQLTNTTAQDIKKRHRSLFSEEELKYLDRFNKQGKLFVKFGREPNKAGYDERYDYGGVGDLTSAKDQELYYKVISKMLQAKAKDVQRKTGKEPSIIEVIEAWRGKSIKDDPKYFMKVLATIPLNLNK